MAFLLCFPVVALVGCFSEEFNGAKIYTGAFSDPISKVRILNAGGIRWTDVDIWVAWSGPANLRSNKGYTTCSNLAVIAETFVERDPARQALLRDHAKLSCQKKSGKASGRYFLSHESGIHWWRAWERG